MTTATVSSNFEIIIPEELRKSLGIRPGQKVELIRSGDRIEVIPVRPIKEARGFLRGISTSIKREPDRL